MKKEFSEFGIQTKQSSGQEKTLCPNCSHGRKKSSEPCLSINHEDGVWNCHNCDFSGSLGNNIKTGRLAKKPPQFKRPDFKETDLPDEVIKYLCEERALSREVVRENKIGFENGAITFPYFKNGEVVNIKRRGRGKQFSQEAGAEQTVYKYDDIKNTTIICEGEIDALSCDTATGVSSAISVPGGAKGFTFFQNVEARFAEVEKFIICADQDEPGRAMEMELRRRIGPDKCLRVEFPDGIKDANECLVMFGRETLYNCLRDSRPYPVESVNYAADVDLEKYYMFGDQDGLSTGLVNLDPFLKLEKDIGQLVVVTGIPGHGKSEFVDQVIVNTAKEYGWKWGVFSPENDPLEYHLSKLAEKLIGLPFREGYKTAQGEYKKYSDRMAPEDVVESKAWLNDRVFSICPPEDDITVDSILKILGRLVAVHGIRAAVIDPWNEISSHKERGAIQEHEWIGVQLTRLRRFARNRGVTLFIVAHPTKLQKSEGGSYPPPTAYDIKGSSTWRDKSDVIFCVHRPNIGQEGNQFIVNIGVQKVKKKYLGSIGVAELHYEFKTGRYSDAPIGASNDPN
jgi:twinkle protein